MLRAILNKIFVKSQKKLNFKFLERKAMKTTKTFLKKLKKIVEEKIEDARLICLYEKIGEPMNTSGYGIVSYYSYSSNQKRAKEAFKKAYRGFKYREEGQKCMFSRNGSWQNKPKKNL